MLACAFSTQAQQPAQSTTSDAAQPLTAQTVEPAAASNAQSAPQAQSAPPQVAGDITPEELRQLLVGKPLFLRGGYLDNSLSFDEHGRLLGHSPQGSYTLCVIQVSKVSLNKRKVKLEGVRYGLHFAGQRADEDPGKALDQVRITPKKKVVTIAIDREIMAKPKKAKGKKTRPANETPAAPLAPPQAASNVTTTVTPAHVAKTLRDALDQIFAPKLDERMIAAMPEFWRLYYQAAAHKADYRPSDPAVLRQNTVDRKARLLTKFEPDSNEFAQQNGVAGMTVYHVVVGEDGKAQQIAVSRPIGFGLDENAVEAIRKASFEPAIKDGKPVPVLVDLVVQFRIFSKRTAVASVADPNGKATESALPGPYGVSHP
jgi:TonB family protein